MQLGKASFCVVMKGYCAVIVSVWVYQLFSADLASPSWFTCSDMGALVEAIPKVTCPMRTRPVDTYWLITVVWRRNSSGFPPRNESVMLLCRPFEVGSTEDVRKGRLWV
jgi:hypothetical protein